MTPAARRRNTWPADAPMRVELLWPDKDLSANARVHWSKRAKAAKRARADAAWCAQSAGVKRLEADALTATITFHPPDNRRRDRDNMLSSLKSALDGLADVIGVDDSRWQISIRKAEPRPPHGAVVVEISEGA